MRNMDELFNIEKNIGEVVGVINLTFNVEPSDFKDEQWEKFDEPVVVAKPAQVLDDDGNVVDAPVAD